MKLSDKKRKFIIWKLIPFVNGLDWESYINPEGRTYLKIPEVLKIIVSISLDGEYTEENQTLLNHLTSMYKEKQELLNEIN